MSETERLEILAGLKGSRTRVLEVQLAMETFVEQMAAEGDTLAASLVDELAKARNTMKSENIAASAFLAEAQAS